VRLDQLLVELGSPASPAKSARYHAARRIDVTNLRCLCRSLPEWLCGAVHRTAIVFSSCRIAGAPLRKVRTAVDVTDGAELGVCVRGDVVDLVAGLMMASAAFEAAGAVRAAAASKAVMLVAASRAVCLSRSPDIELPGPRVAQAAFRA
jgi:hypothetical protein